MTMPTYNVSTFPSIAFYFRIATSVSVPVREAQPADVGSVAAVDGTHIAGGGRSLACVSAVYNGAAAGISATRIVSHSYLHLCQM